MRYSIFKSISFLFVFAVLISCNQKKGEKTVSDRPNILFLFADDQRADAMGCAGNTYIRTPNIDQLAEVGVRFTNNYVMGGQHGAICAPSRAMLMSGKSLFHVYDVLDGVTTMPMYFGAHGYETFGTGKWHNGSKSFEASFQEGEDVFIGGMSDHYNTSCRNLVNGKLGKEVKKGFSTDIFADAAIRFIDRYASGKKDRPFFCYVAFTAPHDPRSPRKDYIGMYPDGSIPVPGNFMKYHPFAYDNMYERDENLAPWPRTPEIIQQSLSDYYALITHLDDRVGDIIQTLKDKGLYKNTIIVYAADNGLEIGSHGLLGKQDLYESSTKVPLIISGPGIPKDTESDALVYLYDLFPTLSDLCSLPAPDSIDGKDITSVIKGETPSVRNSLFTTYRYSVRAVRTQDWKLIRYTNRNYNQLFNLKNDPLEINNLASDGKYKDKQEELMKLLEEWQKATDDTANLAPKTILPMDFDPTTHKQELDDFQPEYTIKKFFKGYDATGRNEH